MAFSHWNERMEWWFRKIKSENTSTISIFIILSCGKLGRSVKSGLRSSSKSRTEQTISSKNEPNFIYVGGTVCSASISVSKQSKYSGLKVFLASVPISRKWKCLEFNRPFSNPSVVSTTFFRIKSIQFRIKFIYIEELEFFSKSEISVNLDARSPTVRLVFLWTCFLTNWWWRLLHSKWYFKDDQWCLPPVTHCNFNFSPVIPSAYVLFTWIIRPD